MSELFPGEEKRPPPEVLEQHLNRLLPMVHRDLVRADIPIRITMSTTRRRPSENNPLISVPETVTDHYELPINLFDIPDSRYGARYNLMTAMLDRGIGFYEQRRDDAYWELFNPLVWIAFVLSAPLFILERAGLEDVGPAWLVNLYGWVVQALVLGLMIFGLTKLDVSIPWGEILLFLSRLR